MREPARTRLGDLLRLTLPLWIAMAPLASASFNGTNASAPSMSVSTASLSAPTGLSAVNQNCVVLTSTQVKLTWTATSSTWADGYEVFRKTGAGSYGSIGTVSGQSTVTYTDTTVAFLTSYTYVVQASKNNWRSPDSGSAAITTPTTLCV